MLSTEKPLFIPFFVRKKEVGILAYTALYRKFRPLKFEDFAGQEHITRTLKNQIIADRVGHAYLFSGGRGTGKTSAAKILSRAVNCLNPKDGEPCNECEICTEIINGSLTDVVEMDAASNNSVEDIRSIREEVNFLPTKAKYRVYIIDEVHMLSTGAFNALLKTLEEPPEHVKFILATTEPQKLPTTILSRCQRFDFKKIQEQDIIKRLKIICKESDINITEEALKTIAVLSEGGMRDAISILERCVQDGDKEIVDDKLKDLVGIPKIEYINKITESIINCDEEKALQTVEEVIEEGKDLYNFLWEIIKYIKDILVYKVQGQINLYNENDLKKIDLIAKNVDKEELFNIIYKLSELENDIKWSTQKNIMFEAGILKLITGKRNKVSSNFEKRLDILEEKINSGNIAINTNPTPTQKNETIKKAISEPPKAKEKSTSPNEETLKKISSTDYWKEVTNNLRGKGKITLFTNLMNAKAVELNDMQIGICGLSAFGKKIVEQPENKQEITRAILEVTGKEMQVKVEEEKTIIEKMDKKTDEFNGLDMPINIIDE